MDTGLIITLKVVIITFPNAWRSGLVEAEKSENIKAWGWLEVKSNKLYEIWEWTHTKELFSDLTCAWITEDASFNYTRKEISPIARQKLTMRIQEQSMERRRPVRSTEIQMRERSSKRRSRGHGQGKGLWSSGVHVWAGWRRLYCPLPECTPQGQV